MGERRERSASGKDVTRMEDKEILDLYWARSEQAILETGRKYGVPVNRVAWNILGDRQEAEECMNDTWLAAWNSIPPQRPDPLLTYLCGAIGLGLSESEVDAVLDSVCWSNIR